MKVQKTISLEAITADKAEQMDNFSEYVRECLSGDLHLKHEALKRRIEYLLNVIKIARDQGSQSKTFRDAVEMMIL